MQENVSPISKSVTGYINIACLILSCCFVLFFPQKKQIWYDESVSVLCSKGLYYTDSNALISLPANNSTNISLQNNVGSVFKRTITDNGNSFLYNESLHFFTDAFGNDMNTYVWLSKLCSAGVLIALFFLCRLLWGNSIFTALSVILLLCDRLFWGMAHEIRAYEFGMMFITLAVLFFYRFMYIEEKARNLLLTGLFAVGAILSHYLSIYVILLLVPYIVIGKKAKLFHPKNLVAIAIPVGIAITYLVLAARGFATMSNQNGRIAAKGTPGAFSMIIVVLRSMKFSVLNFKLMAPGFTGSGIVVIITFLFLMAIYAAAVKLADDKRERSNLHLLFLLGFSSTVFLAALCVRSHHYAALYFRYYSFCLPFATLFTTYSLYIICKHRSIATAFKVAAIGVVGIPTIVLFTNALRDQMRVRYNHMYVAKEIIHTHIDTVAVPTWTDAFLIQSFLPANYTLEYLVGNGSEKFTLIRGNYVKKLPVIRINR